MVFSPVQVISAKLKLSFIAFIFPGLWLKREREKGKKKRKRTKSTKTFKVRPMQNCSLETLQPVAITLLWWEASHSSKQSGDSHP